MTKSDIISTISVNTGVSLSDTQKVIDGFITTTVQALNNDEKVCLTGFGNFGVIQYPARIGRNPKSGEAIVLKSSSVVKFKPSTKLKTLIR